VRKEISAGVNLLRSDIFQKIDPMRGELFVVKTAVANAKVWTQSTIAVPLLAVMAHGSNGFDSVWIQDTMRPVGKGDDSRRASAARSMNGTLYLDLPASPVSLP
jgi:hypothetical protein